MCNTGSGALTAITTLPHSSPDGNYRVQASGSQNVLLANFGSITNRPGVYSMTAFMRSTVASEFFSPM